VYELFVGADYAVSKNNADYEIGTTPLNGEKKKEDLKNQASRGIL